MAYYFQHPDYTGGDVRAIGDNEDLALIILSTVYRLTPEQIFSLTYEGYIFGDKRDCDVYNGYERARKALGREE